MIAERLDLTILNLIHPLYLDKESEVYHIRMF